MDNLYSSVEKNVFDDLFNMNDDLFNMNDESDVFWPDDFWKEFSLDKIKDACLELDNKIEKQIKICSKSYIFLLTDEINNFFKNPYDYRNNILPGNGGRKLIKFIVSCRDNHEYNKEIDNKIYEYFTDKVEKIKRTDDNKYYELTLEITQETDNNNDTDADTDADTDSACSGATRDDSKFGGLEIDAHVDDEISEICKDFDINYYETGKINAYYKLPKLDDLIKIIASYTFLNLDEINF